MTAEAALRFRLAAVALAVLLCLGAAIGLVVLVATLPPTWTDARMWLLIAAAACAAGSFVGAWIAWDRAVTVAATHQSLVRTVATVSFRAVLSGAAVIAFLGSLASAPNSLSFDATVTLDRIGPEILGPIATIVGGAGLALTYGLVFFGLPALVVVAPIVTIWVLVVRRLAHEQPFAP